MNDDLSTHRSEISLTAKASNSASHSLLSDAYGWTRENIVKPLANGAIVGTYNDVAGVANWAAKTVDHPPLMSHMNEWKVAQAKYNSVESFTQGFSSGVGDVLPYVAAAVIGKGVYKYSSTIREAEALKLPLSREEEFKAFTPVENSEIKFNPKDHIGGQDEGNVYSNGDGTVTKVFHKDDHDVAATVAMYQRLNAIGANVPEVFEYGTTASGKPAMVMQMIGDGDHLKYKLMTGGVSQTERASLNKQYYGLADKLVKHNMTIDWNLSNMIFDRNKLYVVDPSFIKDVPMSSQLVDMFAGPIGPR